jgi:hypothetical protein
MAEPGDRLGADLESGEFQHGVFQRFWELVDRAEDVLYVRLYAPDDRTYLVELKCADYDREPIGGRFVDQTTRQCQESAWPRGDGVFSQWVKFTAGTLFICWDQDRYGIDRHPEWRARGAWTRKPNQLVAYLDFLRGLLHNRVHGYVRRPPDVAA